MTPQFVPRGLSEEAMREYHANVAASLEKARQLKTAAEPPKEPPLPGNAITAPKGAAAEPLGPVSGVLTSDVERILDAAVIQRLRPLIGCTDASDDSMRSIVDDFVAGTAQTEDPLERLLLTQVMFLHFRLLKLHVLSDGITVPEGMRVLNTVTSRMLKEMRCLVSTIDSLRRPRSGKAFTVVKLQAVAQQQTVDYHDAPNQTEEKMFVRGRGELMESSAEEVLR